MTDKVNKMTEPGDIPEASDSGTAVATAISRKVGMLRRERRLSFDQLALRSGVSKGLLVQLEQGKSNPSIATLCRIASALGISVAEIVDVGDVQPVKIVGPEAHARLWSGPKGGYGTLVIGSDGPDMLEQWDWELRPGESHQSPPHGRGTREIIWVQSGILSLELDGERHVVEAGSSLYAMTDRPHAYACVGRKPVRFCMVVCEPGRRPRRP